MGEGGTKSRKQDPMAKFSKLTGFTKAGAEAPSTQRGVAEKLKAES